MIVLIGSLDDWLTYTTFYTTHPRVVVDYYTICPCDSRLSHGDLTILISSKGCCIKQIMNGFIRAIVKIFHLLKDWTCYIQLGFASLNRTSNILTQGIFLLSHSYSFIIGIRAFPVGSGLKYVCIITGNNTIARHGGVAQMVERSLSMREVRGAMPRSSSRLWYFVKKLSCLL